VQVFNEESDMTKTCKFLNITAASEVGGATLTPQEGLIVNGRCILTSELTDQTVHLQLEVGSNRELDYAQTLVCGLLGFICVRLNSISHHSP